MTEPEAEPREGIFRKAAVDAAREPRKTRGDVLRLAPQWLHAAYWVVAGLLVTLLVLAASARVNEYARGPALIAASSKAVVTTKAAGLVVDVRVSPGQLVAAGEPLLSLNDDQELADVQHLEAEFDQQLARSLLDRGDRTLRETLVSLRAQRDAARSRLAGRVVRAPVAGRVSDVRARAGQYVAAGTPVLALLDESPRFRVLAFLPGTARPELSVGMPLRLELAGYAYAYQTIRITEVAQQVIGPSEAHRLLGPEVADTLALSGPVTLVQGELDGTSFVVDGRTLDYHDGMPAVAEVPVRQVRLVTLLAPWLRRVF